MFPNRRSTFFRTAFVLVSILSVGALLLGHVPTYALQTEINPTPRGPEPLLPTPSAPAEAKVLTAAEQLLIQNLAESKDLPVETLLVNYSEEMALPVTGVVFTFGKVMDQATGISYSIALDKNGVIVDAEALKQAERDASFAIYGKLHPSLYRHVQGLQAQDAVRLSVWLKMGDLDASIPRLSPSEAADMSAEAIHQYKIEGMVRAAQIHRQAQQPFLDFLPTVGGKLISAAETAPIVFIEIPAQAIQQVANLTYVDALDLLIEGKPENDGDGEQQTGGPEMDTARTVSKANIVNVRGYDGTGVVAAVIEGDSIAFANPYLADGTCGPTASCPGIAEHATAVGGIMASTHSTDRGIAPGMGTNLLSGNGGGWDLSHHQVATTWADGLGADIFNNSYLIEADGAMHNSDRWMDYIVRNYADTEIKSAGNRGESDAYVTSPGLGYNVLTVGAFEDKNTLTWSDDAMAEFSSSVEPAGREKPEVAAVGCGEWVSGVGGVPGIISTGTASPWVYDQGCGTSYAAPVVAGGAALLMQRNAALKSWPEAVKAIFIATALHNIEGSAVKSEYDGAGGIDLAAADLVVANGWWSARSVNGTSFDASNYLVVQTITLYAGEPMRAALAYDSNPSVDYTSDPLEGDLDLYLKNSSGTIVASAAGTDSWEILAYTPTVTDTYTLVVENHAATLSTTATTFIGTAIWPGHYVLSSYASQTRDTPPGNWNQDSGDDYRFTRSSYWNAVGVRFQKTTDYDVFLFDKSVYGNPADHIRREDSALSEDGAVEVVMVDGNHAPSGNYYTTVSRFTGSGNYTTQHATWSGDIISTGTYGPYTASSGDVLRVWDMYFSAGETKYVCVSQSGGSADLGVLLFDSNPDSSASWYQGRSQAVASADKWRSGVSEYLTYTSPDSDYNGLVVFNKGGSSTYNVIVSSTPVADCENWYGGISVTSDQNIVAVGRPHIGSQVTTYNGFMSGGLTAYVPMLFKDAFGGSYDSALYVQNIDPVNSASITIRFYDSNGTQTHSMVDTLSPLASKGYWLPSITALGASWVGGVKVESNRNIVAVGRPHIGSQVMTYDGFTSGSTIAYVPMLFKDAFGGSYDSALYIQNIDASNSASIIIRFYDSSGVQTYSMADTISPLASKGYWLPSIAALGASWVGGVKVESTRNIVAVGRPHIGSEVMTYNGFVGGTLNGYVPMLFKDAYGGSYDSALYIQNVDSANSASITIRFYDAGGAQTYSMADTISPLASKGYWLPSIPGLGASWVGAVKVESNRNIVAVGRPHVGTEITTYAGFTGGALTGYVPMLFKDAFGGGYDSALYIQNLDPVNAANITINLYDSNGNLSCSITDTLPKLSNKGWWLPSLGGCLP